MESYYYVLIAIGLLINVLIIRAVLHLPSIAKNIRIQNKILSLIAEKHGVTKEEIKIASEENPEAEEIKTPYQDFINSKD